MRVLKNKKIVSAVTAIFIFLISCSIFSLMSTTPILSDDNTEIDDNKNTLRSSAISPVFDGMYVNYTFSSDPTYYLTNFSYSHVSGNLYNQTWSIGGLLDYTWLVDIQTRIMSGGSAFSDGTHDPVWIFTNASLGDTIPIAVDGVGDHSFLVSDDLVYDLPSYGPIDVWELEDLTFPGGIAWYEKSTGLLINGTFFYTADIYTYNYTLSFIETNVMFGTPTTIFFDDFESGLSKWQSNTGLWHLTDTGSAWPDPCHSPTHSMWFGNETTGNFDTGFQEVGDLISNPFSLPVSPEITLEFYHWREGEGEPFDGSFVYISIDGINWDLIYSNFSIISPWQEESIDITQYGGNTSVQLKFFFDTLDSINNDYRGWLVDDINITYEGLYEHELSVSLETPVNPQIGNAYLINATVTNDGLNEENDVDLILNLDDVIVESTTISSLPVGASETISYMWIPPDYGVYNFTAYAPPVTDEIYTGNNFRTKIIPIMDIQLFDGMYIDHNYTTSSDTYPSRFSYSFYSGSLFYETWDIMGSPYMWYVDSQTRLMSGGSVFGDDTHTPAWIFTNVSLGDEILIAADGEGDHLFNVSNELIYDLPGFGLIEVWELEDLTPPGGVVWYEKSTGILLNGTFFYSGGTYNYTFDFIDTNVEFISFTFTTPDSTSSWETGTSQDITWTSIGSISDVKIELYKSGVFEREIIATTTNDGTYNWDIPTDLDDGIDYQIKISDVANPPTNDFSDTFEIFTPVVADTITVTNPDTLTVWEMGTSHAITWTSTGTISDVKIELYKGGVFEREIIASTTNDGTYTWDIPTDLEDGIDYQIKISDVSNPATYDESSNFAITSVNIPPAVPSYNLYIVIGIICVVSVILVKNRKKL